MHEFTYKHISLKHACARTVTQTRLHLHTHSHTHKHAYTFMRMSTRIIDNTHAHVLARVGSHITKV